MGYYYCELAGNTGQEDIRFDSLVIPGLSAGNAHVDLQVVYSTFYNGSDLVEPVPLLRITLDARELAEVHIFVGICGSSFFGSAAGGVAVADPLAFD